jgi:hypothetical protein
MKNKKKNTMLTTTVVIAILVAYAALWLAFRAAEQVPGMSHSAGGFIIICLTIFIVPCIGVVAIALQGGSSKIHQIIFLSSTLGVWLTVIGVKYISSDYGKGEIRKTFEKYSMYAEAQKEGKLLGNFMDYDYNHRKRKFYYSNEKLYDVRFNSRNIIEYITHHKNIPDVNEDDYVKIVESKNKKGVTYTAWRKKNNSRYVVLHIENVGFFESDIDLMLNTIFNRDINEDIYHQIREEATFLDECHKDIDGDTTAIRYEFYYTEDELYSYTFYKPAYHSILIGTNIEHSRYTNVFYPEHKEYLEEKGHFAICELKGVNNATYLIFKGVSYRYYILINNVLFQIDHQSAERLVYSKDKNAIHILDKEKFYESFPKL